MAEYMNKELFLRSMGLVGDETKYGNRDGEHQSRSYSTWMGYEIMDSVEDSVAEEDVVPVEQFKAQMIDLVKSYEVLIGCTGVSVLTRAIERMTVAMVEEE